MFFNFSVFFSSLFFLLGLELIVFQSDRIFFLAALIAVFTLHASWRIGKSFSMSITPLIFALSAITLLYLVDSSMQQQYLISMSFFVYYLAFLGIYRLRCYERDKTAHSIMSFVAMSTMFLFYASIYGIYLNFAIPIGVFMLLYCVVTALLSYQYLSMLDAVKTTQARIYSLILGLAMAEVAWVVNFWPFGYLTTGVVVLMFYYILWYLVQGYFSKTLFAKGLFMHLALLSVLIGMVLTSTRWVPIV